MAHERRWMGSPARLPAAALAAGALATALSGCGPDDPGRSGSAMPGDFRQFDSAQVSIAVSGEARARSSLGWEVGVEPDLVLGVRPDPAHEFDRIVGVRELSDGRIVVLDEASQELRFFDGNGTLVRRSGGAGQGPGEFRNARLVPGPIADSLLVWDVRQRRLSVFSEREESVLTITPPSWEGGRPPIGVAGSWGLVDHLAGPIVFDPTAPVERGVVEDPARVYSWIGFDSGDRIEIHSFEERYLYQDVNPAGVPVRLGIPFSPRPAGAVVGTHAWITEGATAEIRVHDLEGRLVGLVRIEEERRRIDEQDLRDFIEGRAEGSAERRQYWEEAYADHPIPDRMPTFDTLLVDESGLVWAARYHWDPTVPREWVVFTDEGQALGTVTTPSHLGIRQIGHDFIVGVARDSLGVERVERYGLQRGD